MTKEDRLLTEGEIRSQLAKSLFMEEIELVIKSLNKLQNQRWVEGVEKLNCSFYKTHLNMYLPDWQALKSKMGEK